MVSTTVFVLFVSYDSSLSAANFQKYYNNYFAEVKVYGGLPTYHIDYASKPIQEIGTLRVIPNIDNDIIASFSGLLKADVNVNKELLEGIDIDHFTAFYVEWREGYDENVSNVIDTVYTPWEIDEVNDCNSDIVTNGDFATDLSDWNQIDATITSEPFIWNAGLSESNLITYRKSKIIYQELNLVANVQYGLTCNVTRSGGFNSTFVVYGTNDLLNFSVLYKDESNGNINVSENIVPNQDFKYVGFHFYNNDVANTTVTIDNIVLIPTVCEYLFWGSNSSLPFQGARGGNMYDYISGRPDSKFMTKFNTPTYFTGNKFDLSFINRESSIDTDFSENTILHLNASDFNLPDATAVTTWSDISGNGNDFIAALGNEPLFYNTGGVNGQPILKFNGGMFLDNITLSIDQPFIMYWVGIMDIVGGGQPVIDGVNNSDRVVMQYNVSNDRWAMSAGNQILLNSAPDFTNGNVGKFVFNGDMSRGVIDNIDETPIGANAGIKSIDQLRIGGVADGITPDTYIGNMSEFIIVDANTDPCVLIDIETYLSNKYETYNVSGKAAILNQYSNGSVIKTDNGFIDNVDGVYRLGIPTLEDSTDKFTVGIYSAGDCQDTEVKEVKVNNDCNNQEIYLTWLNSLDGWDYWKFTAEKNHNLNIESKDTIKRNVFSDWDNGFINGDTQNDVIGVTSYKQIEVFSQYLTLDEVQAISEIKQSIRVMVLDGDIKTTVIVDSDSITVFNDGDDETLHTIRFTIQYPDNQIQSQ